MKDKTVFIPPEAPPHRVATTITLPPALRKRIDEVRKKRGVSFSAMIEQFAHFALKHMPKE